MEELEIEKRKMMRINDLASFLVKCKEDKISIDRKYIVFEARKMPKNSETTIFDNGIFLVNDAATVDDYVRFHSGGKIVLGKLYPSEEELSADIKRCAQYSAIGQFKNNWQTKHYKYEWEKWNDEAYELIICGHDRLKDATTKLENSGEYLTPILSAIEIRAYTPGIYPYCPAHDVNRWSD